MKVSTRDIQEPNGACNVTDIMGFKPEEVQSAPFIIQVESIPPIAKELVRQCINKWALQADVEDNVTVIIELASLKRHGPCDCRSTNICCFSL